MRRFRQAIFRIIAICVGLALILIAGVLVAVTVSPRPFARFVQTQFAGGIGVKAVTPADYHELSRNVRVERDIEYPSQFTSNRLDVFSPANTSGPLPTILWVHGGGFVGGDKAGIETWATMIAAHGYTVVSINYALAPDHLYPGPVVQLGEAYEFLKQDPARFPAVDLHRLIIGGDSAGAQMASQFVAIQTNPELARSMRMDAIVPEEDLLAVILYCGPYDLRGLYDSPRRFGRFLVRQLGWSYFGIRRWRDTPQAAQASTVLHVTPDYPATFITDGNHGSFESDARKLEASLRERGVRTDALFFPVERGPVGHEYQFDFSTRESDEAYRRTLAFLTGVITGNNERE